MSKKVFFFYKFIFFLLFFYIILSNTSSLYSEQSEKIKNLIGNLSSEKDISKMIELLNSISWECRYEDPKKGIKYGKEALLLEEKSGNTKEKSRTLINLGLCYLKLKNYEIALQYYFQAAKNARKLNLSKHLAYAHNCIDNIYQLLGQYDKAYTHIFKVLNFFIKTKNKMGIAYSLTSIGNLELNLKKYNKALGYFEKALKIREHIHDYGEKLIVLIKIAKVYYLKNQYNISLEKYFQIEKSIKNPEHKYHYAAVLNGISDNYYMQKKYHQSLKFSKKALEINYRIDAFNRVVGNHISIGKSYIKLSKYNHAVFNINKGMNLAIKFKLKSQKLACLESLVELYETKSEPIKAYTQYKKFIVLKEIIFNEKKKKQIEALRVQYEFENKEREIDLLKNTAHIKDMQKKYLMVFLILGFILLLTLTFRFYKKVKTNRILEQQKSDLENAYTNLKKMNKKMIELEKKNMTIAMSITTNHELKQPLTVIQGYFEVLINKLDKRTFSDKERSYVTKINKSIEKIIYILNKYKESDGFSIDQYDTGKNMIIFNKQSVKKE